MSIEDDTPRAWADALNRLSALTAPCPGFRGDEWTGIHQAAKHFLEHYASRAFALGWTGLDLFGVHRLVGATRVDCCGALMVSGARAVGVDAGGVRFERGSARRNGSGQAFGVPVWEYAKGGAGQ